MQAKQNQNSALMKKIVWAALLFSIFIYNYIAIIKANGIENLKPVDFQSPLFIPISFMAITCLVFSIFIPKFLLKHKREQLKLEGNKITNSMHQILFHPFIIRLVLLEAVCIYGLILSVKYSDQSVFYFSIASVSGFIMNYPSDSYWKKIISKI